MNDRFLSLVTALVGTFKEVLGEVLEEEDARQVKKQNACVLGVRWGEVGRVKKTTSILVASIRSGRARYCSQMCSFMKFLDLVVLFTSSVVPAFPKGGSQAVCQSARRRGQQPELPNCPVVVMVLLSSLHYQIPTQTPITDRSPWASSR